MEKSAIICSLCKPTLGPHVMMVHVNVSRHGRHCVNVISVVPMATGSADSQHTGPQHGLRGAQRSPQISVHAAAVAGS